MTKLNLCVDIDGTITTPYYWLKDGNQYFNTNLKPEDVCEYEIHKVLNVSREEYLRFYDLLGEEIHAKAKLRSRARRILCKLAEYHNIHYVTAREKKMTEVTHWWIDKKKLPVDGIHILGSHYKVDKAKELRCDIFIEDRYENALEISKAGYKVLLIDCNYNRLPIPKEIVRVKDWDDIYNEIILYSDRKLKLDVA
ncbi:5' nucleotidase, NT5C type [Wukongibacter sp. M2B1]|uniref:5' nucleotidase, NT5C type n=1 Tax=Wukongibacter sp. M2B1 TaxID=3088895 RepID=UPI003D7B3C5C